MAKRLSNHIKKEILNLFIDSKFSIDDLSNKFECTKATITRNLKKELGDEKYREIINSRNSKKNLKTFNKGMKLEKYQEKILTFKKEESDFNFVELAPRLRDRYCSKKGTFIYSYPKLIT